VVRAAAQAALDDSGLSDDSKRRSAGKKKRGPSGPQTFLIGAGLMTGARLLLSGRGRNALESLQERLVDFEQRHFETPSKEDLVDDDHDEEPEGEYDDEEPEGEYDDEEPEGEYDDEEPEGEYDDEDEPDDENQDELDEEFERSNGGGARR
jgi:hypothetical protein